MNNFISFVKSFIEESNTRLKNPFISSYLLTILFLSWRETILFCDFDLNPKVRILEIQKIYTEHIIFFSGERFLFAIIIVVLIKFLSTYVPLLIDNINYRGIENRYNIRKEINGIKYTFLFSDAKSKFELSEKRNGSKELEYLTSQIDDLNDRIVSLKDEIISKNNELEILRKKLNESYIKNINDDFNQDELLRNASLVLKKLKENNNIYTFKNIIRGILQPVESNIQNVLLPEYANLLSLGLLKKNQEMEGVVAIPSNELYKYFKITDLGIAAYHISETDIDFL